MSVQNTLYNYPDPLISGASMASSFFGTPTCTQFFQNITYQLKWTGSNPTGTIKIQVSVDYDPRFPNNATWTNVQEPEGTDIFIGPAGVAGNGVFDLNQLGGMWVRVSYGTAVGSVGNMTSKLSAKGF